MAIVKISDLAKDMGLTTEVVLSVLKSLGHSEVKAHNSTIDDSVKSKIRRTMRNTKKAEDEKKVSQQFLDKIHFHKLKGLKDIEINFSSEKRLTGIFGTNGSGKTTILHALACINKPSKEDMPNYKFKFFFKKIKEFSFDGDNFTITQSWRIESNTFDKKEQKIVKRDRWFKDYSNRLVRCIVYMDIKLFVPDIEKVDWRPEIKLKNDSGTPKEDVVSKKVKELAGYVMGREYSEYYENETNKNRKCIGVSNNNVKYYSFNMGAGEQKIFRIFEEILKVPEYSLILIDEIELLLHQDALRRLLEKLNEIAKKQKLQIVFTSHAQFLCDLDFIATRHIYQTPNKTLCFEQTTPEAIQRLTGKAVRTLEVFVEDDVLEQVVRKVFSEKRIQKHIDVKKFGPIENSFTLASAFVLINDNDIDNKLFVLDGDRMRSNEEKLKRIKAHLTGDEPTRAEERNKVLTTIKQLILPQDEQPEHYFHNLICDVDISKLTPEQKEIFDIAKQIGSQDDSHKYFNKIIEYIGNERVIVLNQLIGILALSDKWDEITSEIAEWAESKKSLFEDFQ